MNIDNDLSFCPIVYKFSDIKVEIDYNLKLDTEWYLKPAPGPFVEIGHE